MGVELFLTLFSFGLLVAFVCKVWFDGSLFFELHEVLASVVYETDEDNNLIYKDGELIEKTINILNPLTWHRFFIKGILCKLCFSVQLSLLVGVFACSILPVYSFPVGYLLAVAIIFVTAYSVLIGPMNEERD